MILQAHVSSIRLCWTVYSLLRLLLSDRLQTRFFPRFRPFSSSWQRTIKSKPKDILRNRAFVVVIVVIVHFSPSIRYMAKCVQYDTSGHVFGSYYYYAIYLHVRFAFDPRVSKTLDIFACRNHSREAHALFTQLNLNRFFRSLYLSYALFAVQIQSLNSVFNSIASNSRRQIATFRCIESDRICNLLLHFYRRLWFCDEHQMQSRLVPSPTPHWSETDELCPCEWRNRNARARKTFSRSAIRSQQSDCLHAHKQHIGLWLTVPMTSKRSE